MREGLDQPGLAGVAAGVRAEWRDEQEAADADAATMWRRSRSLTDWLTDRMHAGDWVAVVVGGTRIAGSVEEVGPDLVALRDEFGRTDVNLAVPLPVAFAVRDRVGHGGRRAATARNFRDAVAARDGDEVRVAALAVPEGRIGRLRVARDFVLVGHGPEELVLPLAQTAWVAPVRRDR
ncbi:MAG: hypothetical protein ACKO1Y_06615 [Actinomycetota bacterium]